MRGVGTYCSFRSVFLVLALTATILSGCSRPSSVQSNLNESALETPEEEHKVIVKEIFNQGIKIINAGNAFKDAWDQNQSLFNFGAGPTDTQVIDLGNSYINTLNDLRNKLLEPGVKERLRAAVVKHDKLNESVFSSAYTALCENLQLAGGGTASSIATLDTSGKIIFLGSMTTQQIENTTFLPHNTYAEAIIRDLNTILAPYATFTMGYEAPTF